MQAVVVTTTTDSRESAGRLADALVARRLAACVQTWPIGSTYRWQGKTEHAEEWIVAGKTRAELAEAATAALVELHTYDVPEIIVTPIAGGHAPYLAWIGDETAAAAPEPAP